MILQGCNAHPGRQPRWPWMYFTVTRLQPTLCATNDTRRACFLALCWQDGVTRTLSSNRSLIVHSQIAAQCSLDFALSRAPAHNEHWTLSSNRQLYRSYKAHSLLSPSRTICQRLVGAPPAVIHHYMDVSISTAPCRFRSVNRLISPHSRTSNTTHSSLTVLSRKTR